MSWFVRVEMDPKEWTSYSSLWRLSLEMESKFKGEVRFFSGGVAYNWFSCVGEGAVILTFEVCLSSPPSITGVEDFLLSIQEEWRDFFSSFRVFLQNCEEMSHPSCLTEEGAQAFLWKDGKIERFLLPSEEREFLVTHYGWDVSSLEEAVLQSFYRRLEEKPCPK